MKLPYTLIFSFFLLPTLIKAQQTGIFQTYVIISIDGGSNSYRAGGINSDNATSFNNSTYAPNSSIALNGGEIKTYKNGGGDVTGARLYYRVYPTNNPSGSFTLVTLNFDSNLGNNGDQKWATTNAGINLANGLVSGTYTLEVYWQITTNLGDRYDLNNGANYKATFAVTNTTLPVTLASFSARANGLMANLDWSTTAEVANAYFDIERSPDAKAFMKVGRVLGQGITASRQYYGFTDESPGAGTTYYRLKQVDTDGRFSYSPIRAVVIRPSGELTILGNPVNTDLNVAGLVPGSSAELLDMRGQLHHQQSVTTNQMQVDVRTMPVGTYLLRVVEPTGTLTRRVLISR